MTTAPGAIPDSTLNAERKRGASPYRQKQRLPVKKYTDIRIIWDSSTVFLSYGSVDLNGDVWLVVASVLEEAIHWVSEGLTFRI